jgi:phosphoribosylglycinamide formyltransferase-1
MADGVPVRLAVLVSGNGTNLQAVIDRIEACEINARIVCVVSNRQDAFALKRAEQHGIPAVIHELGAYASRREYDGALVEILLDHGVQLILLAGFMRILTDVMVDAYPHAILNIHPALLPAFPGLHAQQQALEYGVRFTGCTVHFVDRGTDTGPIILQSVVPIHEDDTEETLAVRIRQEEHRIYPEAVRLFCAGKISMNGRRVRILS